MSAKSIFIIVVSVLVTIILMKNTDEVQFWIFGEANIPKLAILGVMFALGFIVGALAVRPRKKVQIVKHYDEEDETAVQNPPKPTLSDEDRDYIN
ncbi:hypothetical protein FW774_14335 [Pedobacter sp. BS3]|uniref:hypothetical protein n=1 Tax=Pedobacter sp. BS3 TaxID=2567937 RepID=UPI0011EC19D9|nr:hypothetical protein [Pedobacter sp. BS3]TZF82675.1 hypothetical protein FW774_14335 [Pedobacter sp. BS3]